jgi:hypothetical protein
MNAQQRRKTPREIETTDDGEFQGSRRRKIRSKRRNIVDWADDIPSERVEEKIF